jgi:hypothetical protein
VDEFIDWPSLCENPNATHIVQRFPDLIHWDYISENQNAIDFIQENKEHISWEWLYTNPAIFEIDYDKIKQMKQHLTEEIMMKCFHPKRLVYFLKTYQYCIGNDEYVEDTFDML